MTKVVEVPKPPEGLVLSPIPNIRMAKGAVDWIAENLGLEVSENLVRCKTNEKLIRYSKIAGIRHYSSQALWDWVMSMEKVSA